MFSSKISPVPESLAGETDARSMVLPYTHEPAESFPTVAAGSNRSGSTSAPLAHLPPAHRHGVDEGVELARLDGLPRAVLYRAVLADEQHREAAGLDPEPLTRLRSLPGRDRLPAEAARPVL